MHNEWRVSKECFVALFRTCISCIDQDLNLGPCMFEPRTDFAVGCSVDL